MILFFVSFIAGVLTVLAPCVLPLLPIIVGGSIAEGGNKRRAYTIVISLGISIILFTLLLKASTVFISIPQSAWALFSGGVLVLFGLTMLFPALWDSLGFVNLMNRQSNKALAAGYQKNSFWGDVLMGAALGPVFSSCSPTYFVILATVLPASFAAGFLDLFAYAVGVSGFLLVIALAGQSLVDKLGLAINPKGWFRRALGVLFIVVGVAVGTGAEASFERYLFEKGFDPTGIERAILELSEKDEGLKPSGASDSSDSSPVTTPVSEDTSNSGAVAATPAKATPTPKPSILSLAEKAIRFPRAPELVSPDGYLNTGGNPISIGEFKGKKVVLIDFWTYSCINCQRTLPYVESWYEKYKDKGLVIIGVHTPEFAFEHVYDNVAEAIKKFGLTYPSVQDNEYKTWNAFSNRYWPRKYLIDIDGFIVYDHAGEGSYDETEKAIQKALEERAARLGADMPESAESEQPKGVISVEASKVKSPEVYFGASRNEYLGNGMQGKEGEQTFSFPSIAQPNTLYLSGAWSITDEYATNKASGAGIEFVYNAKNVYIVAASDTPVKVRVTRDNGTSLGSEKGADVDADGFVTIGEDRLYQLIEGSSYGPHTLKLEVQGPGLKAYTFTFG